MPARPTVRLTIVLMLLLVPTALPLRAGLTLKQARQHVIMVDERGRYLDPGSKWKLLSSGAEVDAFSYTNSVSSIEAGIREFSRTQPSGRGRVVVFAHGGLNSYRSSKRRLEKLLDGGMVEEGYYPVLLVWNSGFYDSYVEHLLSVRQGEIRPVLGKITAPVVLVVDVAKGIVRLPLTLAGRWYNDFRTAEMPGRWDSATRAWEDLEARIDDWQHEREDIRPEKAFIRRPKPEGRIRGLGERMYRLGSYLITQPTKIATLPFADGLGTQAWDNMVRRTRTMFQPPEPYDYPAYYRKRLFFRKVSREERQRDVDNWMARGAVGGDTRRKPDGTMYHFALQLEVWTGTEHVFGETLRWEFFGHSMGTMVLNEVFRVAPKIRASRITYMAAACSIRSFQETLVPYLRRQKADYSNVVHFHNLCLHRIRERDNSMDMVDIIPRGTLLNYIDDVFAKPPTITDRTLGSWENVIRALPDLPGDLRPQIHNVCFDLLPWSFAGSNTNQPQNHGSFSSDFKFWLDEFVRGPGEVPADDPSRPAIRRSPSLK
ncbi:MAG TPA: hypothetical protein VMS21_15430 [Methylomirabilota bacterium]|nr:hypothetical protein [Methylomirabilota bacterium]